MGTFAFIYFIFSSIVSSVLSCIWVATREERGKFVTVWDYVFWIIISIVMAFVTTLIPIWIWACILGFVIFAAITIYTARKMAKKVIAFCSICKGQS
jgi:hypothetical protein